MDPNKRFSGSPHPGQEQQVQTAWDRHLRDIGRPSDVVRPVIERSWSRCVSSGVDPGRSRAESPVPDEEISRLRHRHRDLVDAGAPIMSQVRESLSETGTIMILAEPSGVILTMDGDTRTLDAAEGIRLVSGANWDELTCGTNAIGTALSVGEPVQVHATEHFCEGVKPWSCSATVVRDPLRRDVLGVLDVSGLSDRFDRHWLAIAMATAGHIEADLAVRDLTLQHRLMDAGLRSLSRAASRTVIFFDRKGRLVNDGNAARYLAAIGVRLDRSTCFSIDQFDASAAVRSRTAALPDWLRPEWVQPVMNDGERLGTLVVLPDILQREPGRRLVSSAASTSRRAETRTSLGPIIGTSNALRSVLEKVRQLADVEVPVVLQGETGVGKELFARAIHEGRSRHQGPFVALNCGGLPRDTLASELFGYVDGAFTGAKRSGMVGKIEAANGGTLFLDEIGELPLDLQPYFLRVLEGGEVYRLGETKPRKVEFRLIVATNKDLRSEVGAGRFRQDLFYRVSGTALRIPSLRDRTEDLPELIEHFSLDVSRRYGVPMKPFESDALDALRRYPWPGNVRELRNVVEGLATLAPGDVVTVADLPEEVTSSVSGTDVRIAVSREVSTVSDLSTVERDAVRTAIARRHGNLTLVAQELGISKSTLYLKIRKYGLDELLVEARRRDR
jgi:sigma-54 dependent transcriptional regulator, acetoin dehydrogenase operon transcriptional activator AcoR